MHVLQWIAVQAKDKDEAYRIVEYSLQERLGERESYTMTWYDWFVVGGGRWNVNEGDDFKEAYNEGKTNLIISYDEDPQYFRTRLLQCMEDRKAEFDGYASNVDPSIITKMITSYNPNEFDFPSFQELYPIKKMIDMAYGQWDMNSYFYDMDNDTTTPKYLYESIDKGNKNWYAVPVDFHF